MVRFMKGLLLALAYVLLILWPLGLSLLEARAEGRRPPRSWKMR